MTTPAGQPKKIHHWKHGWIPLDDFARNILAQREKKKVPYRPYDTSDQDRKIREPAKDELADAMAAGDAKITKRSLSDGPPSPGHAHLDHVEGTPVDFLVQPSDPAYPTDHYTLTPAREREVAAAAKEVWDRFPGLKKESPGITDGTVLMRGVQDTGNPFADEAFATTDVRPPFTIEIHSSLFDKETVEGAIAGSFGNGGAIEGEAKSARDMRRQAVIHELGHWIMARNISENGGDTTAGTEATGGPIDDFVSEPVTPWDMGFREVGAIHPVDARRYLQEQTTPRWSADGLRIHAGADVPSPPRSAYGVQNKWEWFAEAFLDGFVNGDAASSTGQRAVQIVEEVYG